MAAAPGALVDGISEGVRTVSGEFADAAPAASTRPNRRTAKGAFNEAFKAAIFRHPQRPEGSEVRASAQSGIVHDLNVP